MAKRKGTTSWEQVASWYNGWVGKAGSHYHRHVAIPTALELLELRNNEKVLDIGAGTGVLAQHVTRARADYTGVELSPAMLKLAKRYHPKARFIRGDACYLQKYSELAATFDAAIFLLSLQDMNPLGAALSSASWALKPGGRLVIFMVHPCFRVPRQSGWGFDKNRKLTYRRVDRYLSPLAVPMKTHGKGSTKSFHRPLGIYISALKQAGLGLEQLIELPDSPLGGKPDPNPDIPLFLALSARKL